MNLCIFKILDDYDFFEHCPYSDGTICYERKLGEGSVTYKINGTKELLEVKAPNGLSVVTMMNPGAEKLQNLLAGIPFLNLSLNKGYDTYLEAC